MNHCPESKGIKTYRDSDSVSILGMNHCPESKGIKTSLSVPTVIACANESLP
ncbi:MAG: hypothetical protein RIR79_1055 [Pseudomonadota bacterium]